MGNVRKALNAFQFRLRHPLPVHHPTWTAYDHEHICIAARILDEESFTQVCPCGGNCDIDMDEACDTCKYLKILSYCQTRSGKKYVSLD